MSDDDVRTQSRMESCKVVLCRPSVQFQTCFKNVRLAFCLQTRAARAALPLILVAAQSASGFRLFSARINDAEDPKEHARKQYKERPCC
jgi:hypothetical protein